MFGGPPRSGKSCLRAGLKEHVRLRGHYLYVITANPDGEGAWFHESYGANPEQAAAYKARYKQLWSEHFEQRVEKYCDDVRLCQEPLLASTSAE